jgi:hypothetical protein
LQASPSGLDAIEKAQSFRAIRFPEFKGSVPLIVILNAESLSLHAKLEQSLFQSGRIGGAVT